MKVNNAFICLLTNVKGSLRFPKTLKSLGNPYLYFNTQYMTNSTLVSPVKMEYGWNFSISGLKMMMKSGLGKIFLKFLHALTMLFLLLNLYFWSKFSNKSDMVSAWRNFKNIFSRPLFTIIFRPEMLKFHPYSILTGDTMVGFVIFCVFSKDHCSAVASQLCKFHIHCTLPHDGVQKKLF